MEAVLAMAITTISSLSESFISVAPASQEETIEREAVKSVVIPKEEALKVDDYSHSESGARGDIVAVGNELSNGNGSEDLESGA